MKRILFALVLALAIAGPSVALATTTAACSAPSDPGLPPDC